MGFTPRGVLCPRMTRVRDIYIYVCVFTYVDLKVVGQAGALRIAADIVSPGVETTRCCEANTPTTVHR